MSSSDEEEVALFIGLFGGIGSSGEGEDGCVLVQFF